MCSNNFNVLRGLTQLRSTEKILAPVANQVSILKQYSHTVSKRTGGPLQFLTAHTELNLHVLATEYFQCLVFIVSTAIQRAILPSVNFVMLQISQLLLSLQASPQSQNIDSLEDSSTRLAAAVKQLINAALKLKHAPDEVSQVS